MYEHFIMQNLETITPATTQATTPAITEEETLTPTATSEEVVESTPVATGEEVAETKPVTKIRASDFTLEEKQSLVEKARKETFAKVAKETGIPATMLYNWNYNFNHNRHMRSKGDIKKTATANRQSTATRQEKSSPDKTTAATTATADKTLLILESAATDKTVTMAATENTTAAIDKATDKTAAATATASQNKHESKHKQNPVTKIQDGKNDQDWKDDKDLRIENAILKERIELLTRQVEKLREALGVVVGK